MQKQAHTLRTLADDMQFSLVEEAANFEDTMTYTVLNTVSLDVLNHADQMLIKDGLYDDVELDELPEIDNFWDNLIYTAHNAADSFEACTNVNDEIFSENYRNGNIDMTVRDLDGGTDTRLDDLIDAATAQIRRDLAYHFVQGLKQEIINAEDE